MNKKKMLVFIGMEDLARMVFGFGINCFPVLENIPKGIGVQRMYFDYEKNGLVIEVIHDSFEEVPDGVIPPFAPWKITYIALNKDQTPEN